MVTEDHDFAEINHAHIFGKKLEWCKEVNGPTGRVKTDSLTDVLNELKQILGEGENAKYLFELFSKAYLEHDDLEKATRYFINELFGDQGLVILDPDDNKLKAKFIPIAKDEICNHSSCNLVEKTNDELKTSGYHVQVNPREINLFYLQDDLRGRIVKEGDEFKILNSDISFDSESSILEDLEKNPRSYGPNVITRPFYQELILPNLAYIGGGAEIAYWLQFKSSFEHHQICFPALILRNSAMIIDEASRKRLDKLGFTPFDLFNNIDFLNKKFVTDRSQDELSLANELKEFETIFERVSLKAEEIDKGLAGMVQAEKVKQSKVIKNIEQKLLKAEKGKFDIELGQIKKLKDKLFPNGALQERYDNFMPYYLKYGQSFVETLINNFNPLENKFIIYT